MAVNQGEVDAWRGAAGPLLEAMGITAEEEPAAPETTAGDWEQLPPAPQAAPESVAPEVQETDAPAEAPALPEIPDFKPVDLDELEDDDDEPYVVDNTIYNTADDDETYVDDETRRLRAELAKAQKALENERKQRVESNVGRWREKYKQMYPLADVDEIKATSRREFERQAALSHNKAYKVLEPQLKLLREAREKILEEARLEGKADAAAAYGKPTTGPGAAPAIRGERDAVLAESRKNSKNLYEHFKTMLALEDSTRG